MRHIYTLVSKLRLPLDRTLTTCGHATHHLTLGVEAFDPYITTQVNGTHIIAHRMHDEIKTHILVLIWPPKILNYAYGK